MVCLSTIYPIITPIAKISYTFIDISLSTCNSNTQFSLKNLNMESEGTKTDLKTQLHRLTRFKYSLDSQTGHHLTVQLKRAHLSQLPLTLLALTSPSKCSPLLAERGQLHCCFPRTHTLSSFHGICSSQLQHTCLCPWESTGHTAVGEFQIMPNVLNIYLMVCQFIRA